MIRLGHVDTLPAVNTNISRQKNLETFKKHYDSREISDTTATNQINQLMHFIYDAEIGDVVVSVGAGQVYIGRIVSNSNFDKEKKEN